MLQALFAAAAVMLVSDLAQADNAKLDATFVGDDTYSPTTGCKKLEDIENGKATPNISTYPLTLTRAGTGSWEGSCNFEQLRELNPNVFEGKMQCSEGAEEYAETVTFTRLNADRIEVRSGMEALVYERCKGLKGKVER